MFWLLMSSIVAQAAQGGSAAIGITDSTTVYRSIYYARYVDWFLTTPLLLLDLTLISGVKFGDYLWIAACDILMVSPCSLLPGMSFHSWVGFKLSLCAPYANPTQHLMVAMLLQILTGLFGATSSHRYKWGFFGAGCLFQVFLFVGMLFPGAVPGVACQAAPAC